MGCALIVCNLWRIAWLLGFTEGTIVCGASQLCKLQWPLPLVGWLLLERPLLCLAYKICGRFLQTPFRDPFFYICILRRKRDQFSLNSGNSLVCLGLSISNQIYSSHCSSSYLVAYHFSLRCVKSPPGTSLTDRHPCLSENHTLSDRYTHTKDRVWPPLCGLRIRALCTKWRDMRLDYYQQLHQHCEQNALEI